MKLIVDYTCTLVTVVTLSIVRVGYKYYVISGGIHSFCG
jgi:hypothetical protein